MSPSSTAATQRGSPPSFSELYETHFEFVYGSLKRLGAAPADLEDLTQEVFMVAHRRLPTYDVERPIRPWLFGIAFRVLSDRRRSLKNNQSPEPLDENLEDVQVRPDVGLEERETRELVQQALTTLDFERRAVFVMHDMQGETAPDISRSLDVPLNTVYSRLRLARKDFTTAVRRLVARRTTP